MAISLLAITAIIVKMAIMAIMAQRDMAIRMVLMGVFLKHSKNVDHWPKWRIKYECSKKLSPK